MRRPERVVDVWHLELGAAQADSTLLTADECARAERYRIDRRRHEFVAGRAALRRILGGYLGCGPRAVVLALGAHDKPELGNPGAAAARLHFNLSHSEGRGLLAVSTQEVGVDIEYVRENRNLAGIARRFFAAAESQAFLGLAADLHLAEFYRIWTHKEAYLKACGTGLSFPSNRFTLDFTAQPVRLLATDMPGDVVGHWQFHGLPAAPGYAAAVCYRGERVRPGAFTLADPR
ncbi:MAG: 4'-phosphopantetheinyl transferase superfamily protein [Planctomycetes bacterium]|nr:4'-phosphopantetheinyl transferase superfamily protein [Planctomycetota bacterium]MCB9871047.1 4'-phosphopantetheinyl transferase superfamily protein [Planctomycetota bacterium]